MLGLSRFFGLKVLLEEPRSLQGPSPLRHRPHVSNPQAAIRSPQSSPAALAWILAVEYDQYQQLLERIMCRPVSLIAAVLALGLTAAADEVLYSYEGDVPPHDPSAGWVIAKSCTYPCSESVEDGHYVLHWVEANDQVNYDYSISEPPEGLPPSLWVEWRFRSNHPLGPYFYGCDGHFTAYYGSTHERVNLYGDAVIASSGDNFVTGLDINEFHTYRYESLDGISFRISVDGLVFIAGPDCDPWTDYPYLQFGGSGGCLGDWIPNMVNEWDFVRFGTLASDELIVATGPPGGRVDPNVHPFVDHFTVTFAAANYVYLDGVTVEVTEGAAPLVRQTRRLDNGAPETVEIVLDRPIPYQGVTTFTFEGDQFMRYTYETSPICGDYVVNQPEEECDGTDDANCPGGCGLLCTCPAAAGPECGNGIVEIGEECDGTDDAACPGQCREDCTCPPPIPTVSQWGLLILTLLLLIAAKLSFSYRRAA